MSKHKNRKAHDAKHLFQASANFTYGSRPSLFRISEHNFCAKLLRKQVISFYRRRPQCSIWCAQSAGACFLYCGGSVRCSTRISRILSANPIYSVQTGACVHLISARHFVNFSNCSSVLLVCFFLRSLCCCCCWCACMHLCFHAFVYDADSLCCACDAWAGWLARVVEVKSVGFGAHKRKQVVRDTATSICGWLIRNENRATTIRELYVHIHVL